MNFSFIFCILIFYLRCFFIKLIHTDFKIFEKKNRKGKRKKSSIMATPKAKTDINLFLNLA